MPDPQKVSILVHLSRGLLVKSPHKILGARVEPVTDGLTTENYILVHRSTK